MKNDVHQIRYRRLRQLLQLKFDNKQVRMAAAIGKSSTYTNFLLNDPELPHHKNLGEHLAREIEHKLGLETGWLDREDGLEDILPIRRGVVAGVRAETEFVEVRRRRVMLAAGSGEMVFEEEHSPPLGFRRDWLQKNNLDPDKLVVAYAKGDSMEPRIHDGDTLLIDTNQTNIQSGCVYAIRVGDELKVKSLHRLTVGVLIESTNKTYPSETLRLEEAEASLHIIGRVVWVSGVL
jgi:phage repressor protein C with HTH and peptisase S24 domain